jgi:hypothetical protein
MPKGRCLWGIQHRRELLSQSKINPGTNCSNKHANAKHGIAAGSRATIYSLLKTRGKTTLEEAGEGVCTWGPPHSTTFCLI